MADQQPPDPAHALGLNIFLATLALMTIHSKLDGNKQKRLMARIVALGVCIAALVLHFTALYSAAAVTALAVWLPLPILRWWAERQRQAAPAPQKRGLFAKMPVSKECPPCKPCQ